MPGGYKKLVKNPSAEKNSLSLVNALAHVFPVERNYLASKQLSNLRFKEWLDIAYNHNLTGVGESKRDPLKFFNPMKPLFIALHFAMSKIASLIDNNFFNEQGDFASSVPQRIAKGICLIPLLILAAPLRLINNVIDSSITAAIMSGKLIFTSNPTVIPATNLEKIKNNLAKSYATYYDSQQKTIGAFDPVKLINPFKPLRIGLAIMTRQIAASSDSLFPGQNNASSLASRITKGLIVSPLLLAVMPIFILEASVDTLLAPISNVVSVARVFINTGSITHNLPLAETPTPKTNTLESLPVSFPSTTGKLIKRGIAHIFKTPDLSAHGLVKEEIKALKKDPANKADLKTLYALYKEYHQLTKGMDISEINRILKLPLEQQDTSFKLRLEKLNAIQEIIIRLREKLPSPVLITPPTVNAPTMSSPSIAPPSPAPYRQR